MPAGQPAFALLGQQQGPVQEVGPPVQVHMVSMVLLAVLTLALAVTQGWPDSTPP